MKKYSISILILVFSCLYLHSLVLSADNSSQKKLVGEVNDFAVEKLGLSLEEISLLFSFRKKTFIGAEVIQEYLAIEHMDTLLERKYLTLETAADLGNDITGGDTFYYFELTKKGKVLVGL